MAEMFATIVHDDIVMTGVGDGHQDDTTAALSHELELSIGGPLCLDVHVTSLPLPRSCPRTQA